MKALTFLFGVLLLVGASVGTVIAENKTVVATGSSTLSVEDAVRQAQRLAVEEAVGVFIQSETEVENFVLKKDKILSRTQGYVTRYELLSQERAGDTIEVKIEATISLEKIKDDLIAMKILLESMERPKLMVLIDEDYTSMDDLGMHIAGTELAAQLGKKGFELVDKAQLEAVRDIAQKQQALAGNTAAAASMGLQLGAQYVIVGKAVAQDAGEAVPGTGLKSVQVSLQLQVIQAQTASVIGSTVQNGVAAHISPLTGATKAFQDAVTRAVDGYLVDTITNSFQDFLNNGAPIKLHLTGVQTFQEYKQVLQEIEAMPRVVSCKKEGWSSSGGLLLLDLRFKGTSEELASLLDNMAIGGKKIVVSDLAPERVNGVYR